MIRALSYAILVCGVSACSLYWPSHPPDEDDDDAPPAAQCDGPAPGSNCECTDTIGWACNSCPFGEGSDPVACGTPGAGCELETWEHGCGCVCGSDGWWSCMPETIGSTCPIDPGPACAPIEAESIAQPGDWSVIYGNALSGGEGLTASSGSGMLVFQFTGTGLDMSVEQGPYDGIISISIDGGAPIVESLGIPGGSASAFETQNVTTGLASGTHDVVVTCPTLVCSIDYFSPECAAQL